MSVAWWSIYIDAAKFVREDRGMTVEEWLAFPESARTDMVEDAVRENGVPFFEERIAKNAITAIPAV